MFRPSAELVVLCFGLLAVFASLEHIPDVRKRGILFICIFVGEVTTQLFAHGFQYAFAVTNREEAAKRIDAETAIALFAYKNKDVELLKKTTKDAYLIGYLLFENGQLDDAIPYFKQALHEDRYVAASDYVLAYIDTHDKNGKLDVNKKDWSEAFGLLDQSISNYPDYAQAYYLLAQLYANSRQEDKALDNLYNAVMYTQFSLVPCSNLNTKQLPTEWVPLSDSQRFKAIQQQCKKIHGLD